MQDKQMKLKQKQMLTCASSSGFTSSLSPSGDICNKQREPTLLGQRFMKFQLKLREHCSRSTFVTSSCCCAGSAAATALHCTALLVVHVTVLPDKSAGQFSHCTHQVLQYEGLHTGLPTDGWCLQLFRVRGIRCECTIL